MDVSRSKILADKDEIRDQIYRYCRAIDRMDYDLIQTVWHPDGTIDFSDGSVDPNYKPGPPPVPCMKHFEFTWPWRATLHTHSHQATNIMIEVDGDRAGSETTSITVLQKLKDGKIEQTMIWGRWLDRWSRRNGRWAIDHRQGVMDCAETREFALAPINDVTKHSSRRDRQDPSYNYLRGTTSLRSVEIVQRYFKLLRTMDANGMRDLDAIMAFWSDDIHYEIPYAPAGVETVMDGKEAAGAMMKWTQGQFRDIRQTITGMFYDPDQNVVTVEALMSRIIHKTGKLYENRYIFVITLRDGLIVRFHEYLNPIPASATVE